MSTAQNAMPHASMREAAAPSSSRHARRTESYEALLGRLSHQSVVKHFDAYADIDWEGADFQLDASDPVFERTEDDSLGATDWYRSQPQELRARIGLHMAVTHMKIGLEFESVLKRGLLEFATTLPNNSPEFRYAYHEVIEEAQHSLMFQEFVNRSGLPARGLKPKMRRQARLVASTGRWFPELFFVFVLGGEEPIDNVQRKELRSGRKLHPLVKRIMQIHVTEEARHLCFAQKFLEKNVPELSPAKSAALRTLAPVILGEMSRLMMQASPEIIESYQIPDAVVDEAYTHNAAHRAKVHENIANVRQLCGKLGLINRRSVHLWKWGGIWPQGEQVPLP
jgi:hypothetical protein